MEATRAQKVNFWWSTTQFTICGVFMANFLYFIIRYNHRKHEMADEALCYAKPDINHPVEITNNTNMDEVHNVGKQFFAVFIAGLVLNTLTAIWSIAACCISQTQRAFLYAMQTLVFIANLTFTIVVTCVRFSHSGKVCSGDYLFDLEAEFTN